MKPSWVTRRFTLAVALLAAGAALVVSRTASADHQCAQWKDINVAFVIDYSSSMAGPRANIARSFATQVFNDLDNDGILTRVGWVGYPQPVTTVPLDTTSHSAVLNALQSTPSDRSEGPPESVYRVIEDAANVMANQPSSAINLLIVVVDVLDLGVWTDAASDAFNDAATALRANGEWNYIVFPEDNPGIFIDARDLAQLGASNFASSLGAVPNLVDRVRQEACISALPHRPTAALEILRPEAGSLVADSDLLLGIEGFELVFDASASGDPEDANTDLHYAWLLTRPDQTTLRYTGFGVTAMTPRFQFSDEWLLSGTEHSVTLQVTDTDGNVSDPISRDFTVTGSPPDIVLEGAVDVDVGDWQRIWVRYQGTTAPNTDIDGGPASHVLRIDQAPAGGLPAQGTTSPPNSEIQRTTTQGDIGQWIVTATATDDEGDTDTATASFVVRNTPLELTLSGTEQVDVGDTVLVESLLVDDPDNGVGGGGLTFDWEIIQAPVGASPGLQTPLANSSSITFATTDAEAGTYVFRLTVTDDEPAPWTETAEAEFTVLVNAPPVAEIAGGSPVGSLSLPAQLLSGTGSSDPDSDRPHERLDSLPPHGLSAGVTDYTWTLIDTSSDLLDDYPPGNVEDVFGVSGRGADLGIAELEPGFYVVQLEVTDAEGSSDSTTFTVEVIDEGGPPLVEIWPPAARYTVDVTNTLWADLTFSGAASLDIDNAISGDPLPGIDDYTWGIMVAPPGCGVLPTEPSGASADHFTLATGGSVIDLACQGYWQVGLTVTDDDTTPKQAIADAVAVIGNCDGVICIDYPTTSFPAVVDYAEDTDIHIYYHLDSGIYPFFASGLMAYLEIFHESDSNTPFKTAYDPNLLPSNLGGYLVFHWDGFGDNGARPPPGRYDVRVSLADHNLGNTGIGAEHTAAVYIATAQPTVLPSTVSYVDWSELIAGNVPIDIDYEVSGSATFDELRWRAYLKRTGALLAEGSVSNAATSGTLRLSDALGIEDLAQLPGVIEVELETLRGGALMGVSGEHRLVVYHLSATSDYGSPADPSQIYIALNDDDDNADGVVDLDQPNPANGEDDGAFFELIFEPSGIPENLVLKAKSGLDKMRVWALQGGLNQINLDRSFDLTTGSIPPEIFVEGVESGMAALALVLEDPDGGVVDEREFTIHVVRLDLDIDADMNGVIDNRDEGLDDNETFPMIANVNNDDDGPRGVDSQNDSVDGEFDLLDMEKLVLRQMPYIPPNTNVVLRVSDNYPVRVFGELLNTVISPIQGPGNIDRIEVEIPAANIAAGDLEYWFEIVDDIEPQILEIFLSIEQGDDELLYDTVTVVPNVDRRPANDPTNLRNYIQARKLLNGVEGIGAELLADEPLPTWDPRPRNSAMSLMWVGIGAEDPPREDHFSDRWLQSGVRVIQYSSGRRKEHVYFEVVTDYPAYKDGTDETGYQIFYKPLSEWTSGVFQVELANRKIGRAVARFNGGVPWREVIHEDLKTAEFEWYTIATETKESVSRHPGSPKKKARAKNPLVKDALGWRPTIFGPRDITIRWVDGEGNRLVTTANPGDLEAEEHGLHFRWISNTEFEFWDERAYP